MTGLYAHKLPAATPTLRQAAVRAIQASEALTALPSDAADSEFSNIEAAELAARDQLYDALASLGIDRGMARKMGGVL